MEIFVLSLIELHTIHYIVWNNHWFFIRAALYSFSTGKLEVDLWEV